MAHATLLVTCPDRSGLVAALSDFVFRNGGNIIDLDQHTDAESGTFFMRLVFDVAGFRLDRDGIRAAIAVLAQSHGLRTELSFADQRPKVAVFASKVPHCLYDLLLCQQLGELQGDIVAVVSNHAELRGVAEHFHLPFHHLPMRADKAATEAAQEALLQVVTQPGWKQLSKSKAIMAMMSIEAPELSLVKALWTERSRLAGNGMAPGAEMSILTNVYGSLGDIAKGNPALTDLVVGNLARLLATRDMDSRILALDALANVGDFDRVTPLVAGALVSSEVRVRIAAFATFRRMNGDAAFATFADAFARETLPQVRLAAARVASQMAKTQARNDWATTLVARESDAKVQSELVQTLGRAIDAYPENVGTLRNLLDTTRVRAVRKDIYTYVAPVAKGGAR